MKTGTPGRGSGLLALVLLASLAGAARAPRASAQERPLRPSSNGDDGAVGRDLTREAKSAAREVNALLDDLRKKVDALARSPDPASGGELAAIDAYVATASKIKKTCDEYLAEEPRLGERFSRLRVAYSKAIDFFKRAEETQRSKVEGERQNMDVPAEDRERNARLRARYADLYSKDRAVLAAEREKVDDWEKEMHRKFGVLRAKSHLLSRTLEVASMMKTVAEGETETRRFVEDVKKLNAVLDGLLEDIARSQLHETDLTVPDRREPPAPRPEAPGPDRDASPRDAGPRDAGPRDAGPRDAGPRDAGPRDAGPRRP